MLLFFFRDHLKIRPAVKKMPGSKAGLKFRKREFNCVATGSPWKKPDFANRHHIVPFIRCKFIFTQK